METLADRIAREGPINELDAVGWIVRLAKKLEMLHSRGLAHGGISPAAIKTASTSRMSLGMLIPIGGVRNQLEFRSPERLDSEQTSATDDTWSTAVTLYALLTGSSPFVAADSTTIQQKILTGGFAPLSSFDVGDEDLQNILDGALKASFKERTATITGLREALEGWHPDPKVRELPPMADDQPEEDDEDERTVMRQVSAADAVRAIVAQREQTAARAPEPTLPSAHETAAAKPPPVASPQPLMAAAHAHGLMEDDDDNAKTSLISIPPQAYIAALSRGPATVPAPPPPGTVRSAPPVPAATGTGFDLSKAPPRASVGGISRDAVIEDGDNEATVMREAPVELLRQATSSIAPPALDRKTPVDPTSAAVAAAEAAPPTKTAAKAAAMSSLFDDDQSIDRPGPAAKAAEPAPDDEELNATVAYSPPGNDPEPQGAGRVSSTSTPSPAVRNSAPTPTPAAAPTPAPAPTAIEKGRPTPAPPVAMIPDEPPPAQSPLKGLLIGMSLALLLLAGLAAAYFLVLKR